MAALVVRPDELQVAMLATQQPECERTGYSLHLVVAGGGWLRWMGRNGNGLGIAHAVAIMSNEY